MNLLTWSQKHLFVLVIHYYTYTSNLHLNSDCFDILGKICKGTNRWPWAVKSSTWIPKRLVGIITVLWVFWQVDCNWDLISSQGIQFLIENDLLKNTSDDIAQFLYKGEGLNKTAIGDYLGERSGEILFLFCHLLWFDPDLRAPIHLTDEM